MGSQLPALVFVSVTKFPTGLIYPVVIHSTAAKKSSTQQPLMPNETAEKEMEDDL